MLIIQRQFDKRRHNSMMVIIVRQITGNKKSNQNNIVKVKATKCTKK